MHSVVWYKSTTNLILCSQQIIVILLRMNLRQHSAHWMLYFLPLIPTPLSLLSAGMNVSYSANSAKHNYNLVILNMYYPLITPVPALQVWFAPPKEGVTYHGPPFCFKITWLSLLFFSLSPVKCFNTVLSPQSTDALGKRGATRVWNRNAESVWANIARLASLFKSRHGWLSLY